MPPQAARATVAASASLAMKLIFTKNHTWIAGDFDTIAGHATSRLACLKQLGCFAEVSSSAAGIQVIKDPRAASY